MANKESAAISLREIFTPLIARVLLFAQTPASAQGVFPAIRKEINALLEEQKALVKRYEIAPQEYDNARFAVIAWLDEVMLKATHAESQEFYQQWKRAPLQAELYNTANAGEEFFERLEKLRPSQKEVNEIYHLSLSLGFRGRYYDEEQDYKLLEMRRERAQHLPIAFPDLFEIEKKKEHVTPQPYEIQPPPAKVHLRPPSLFWPGVILSTLAVLLLVWWFRPINNCGNGRVDPGEQCDFVVSTGSCPGGQTCQADCTCPPPPPGPSLDAIREAIRPFECHRVEVADVRDGVVNLTGRVQSGEQRQQIRQAVQDVVGVTEVQDTFTFMPRPFCEVIDLLDPLRQHAQTTGASLDLRLQKGCEVTYYRDENLIVDVSSPKPLQYVYADYYVADKEYVAHLVPNPKQPENLYQDQRTLTVGDPNSKAQWHIQAPFGMELVTVIASSRPLLNPPRLEPERAASYIAELRRVLPQDPATSEVTATYCFLTSADK
jgi:type IV/VI secretion system ImpK/VasF family protein